VGRTADELEKAARTDSGRGRLAIAAWCLFDFANSSYTTVIVTTVFAVYFVKTVVGEGPVSGELLWSIAGSISLLFSAALAPPLGALADARALKRAFLIGSSLVCIGATSLLATVGAGQVALAMALYIVANIAFEVGYVFYNGFLPEIASTERAGWISGLGWATGYLGGMLSLAVALIPLSLLLPENATGEQTAHGARIACLLCALHFLVFALPAFALLRDRVAASGSAARAFDPREPFRRLATTLRNFRVYTETWRFLLANLVYNDGVVTIFFFAGIYMSRALQMSQGAIILMILVINLPSALGSLVMGRLADRIGGVKTILLTLAILVATVGGIAMTAPGPSATAAELTRARAAFWALAMVAGLGIGANQSASRGLMAQLIPEARHAEFFGFYIFSGKLSSVLAPLLYGLVIELTRSDALAIASVALFLVAGGLLLLRVNEREGRGRALASSGHAP
jgi:UMF1 family MFS transporter